MTGFMLTAPPRCFPLDVYSVFRAAYPRPILVSFFANVSLSLSFFTPLRPPKTRKHERVRGQDAIYGVADDVKFRQKIRAAVQAGQIARCLCKDKIFTSASRRTESIAASILVS